MYIEKRMLSKKRTAEKMKLLSIFDVFKSGEISNNESGEAITYVSETALKRCTMGEGWSELPQIQGFM